MIHDLKPADLGLPDALPAGSTALPDDTDLALTYFFRQSERGPREGYKHYLPLLAALAEALVLAPRVFCPKQMTDDTVALASIPDLEYWQPDRIISMDPDLTEPLHELVLNSLLEAGVHPKVAIIAYPLRMARWGALLCAELFGLCPRITEYDAGEFRALLHAAAGSLRPPPETTSAVLVKEVERLRTHFFRGISRDFYFQYYDLRVPAILAIALQEASSDSPRSLLHVIHQMRAEKTAVSFRKWCSEVDSLIEKPAKREEALAEARSLLEGLSKSLGDRHVDFSLQVAPMPPFVQFTLPDGFPAAVERAYRSRRPHLAFLHSIATRSLDIGRVADDFARVFGLPEAETPQIQTCFRRAFPVGGSDESPRQQQAA